MERYSVNLKISKYFFHNAGLSLRFQVAGYMQYGAEQLGISSFGSIFLLFPMKMTGDDAHTCTCSRQGKSLAPGP